MVKEQIINGLSVTMLSYNYAVVAFPRLGSAGRRFAGCMERVQGECEDP
jgi:hypothetical protein